MAVIEQHKIRGSANIGCIFALLPILVHHTNHASLQQRLMVPLSRFALIQEALYHPFLESGNDNSEIYGNRTQMFFTLSTVSTPHIEVYHALMPESKSSSLL